MISAIKSLATDSVANDLDTSLASVKDPDVEYNRNRANAEGFVIEALTNKYTFGVLEFSIFPDTNAPAFKLPVMY